MSCLAFVCLFVRAHVRTQGAGLWLRGDRGRAPPARGGGGGGGGGLQEAAPAAGIVVRPSSFPTNVGITLLETATPRVAISEIWVALGCSLGVYFSSTRRPNQQRIGETSVFRDYIQERAHISHRF